MEKTLREHAEPAGGPGLGALLIPIHFQSPVYHQVHAVLAPRDMSQTVPVEECLTLGTRGQPVGLALVPRVKQKKV